MLCHRILDEFSKKLSLSESHKPQSQFGGRQSVSNIHHDQIYDDVQEKLRSVLERIDTNRNENCFILCLKIVSQLIKRQMQEVEDT